MRYRSNELELMDDLSLAPELLKSTLQDISRANRLLGGNRGTLDGVYQLLQQFPELKEVTIVDVGCGDGTQLRELALFLRRKEFKSTLVGIDINETSLEIARSLSIDFPEISFKNQDVLILRKRDFSCDIIITTLTLHHFTDQEIPQFLKQFHKLSRFGIVINDLHRSRLAYRLFKIFSFFFIKSAVAKNDGLVSIERGFTKAELREFSKTLGFEKDTIRWKWAFRYLWIVSKC